MVRVPSCGRATVPGPPFLEISKELTVCSGWLAGDQRVPVRDWQRLPVGLTGVQTGVYQENGVIRATRWIAVTTVIHEAFPELRRALTI